MKNEITEIIKISIISILIFLVLQTPSVSAYNYSKVILIAWDGAQLNDTRNLYTSGQLNGLKEILNNGSWSKLYITDHSTWTDPGFAQILSGYSPNITGVNGTDSWQILRDNLSIFEKLKLRFRNISTSVISSRDSARRWTSNDTLIKENYNGDSGHGFFEWTFTNAMSSIDYFWDATNYSIENSQYIDITNNISNNYTNVSSNRTMYLWQIESNQTEAQTEKWLANHTNDRFFLFIHFGKPDTNGHVFRENSTEYLDAIRDADNSTLNLIEFLKSLGIYNDTVVMVITDHGFEKDGKDHKSKPFPNGNPDNYVTFMAVNKPISNTIKVGYQGDVAPTIYELFGINYTDIYPRFDKAVPIWMR